MFIRINGTAIINTNSIAWVKYSEAKNGVDDESGEQYSIKSRLEITTLSVEYKIESDRFDGTFHGTGTQSQVIVTHGETADRVWKKLCGMCELEEIRQSIDAGL